MCVKDPPICPSPSSSTILLLDSLNLSTPCTSYKENLALFVLVGNGLFHIALCPQELIHVVAHGAVSIILKPE
jgi:hypothetical protein